MRIESCWRLAGAIAVAVFALVGCNDDPGSGNGGTGGETGVDADAASPDDAADGSGNGTTADGTGGDTETPSDDAASDGGSTGGDGGADTADAGDGTGGMDVAPDGDAAVCGNGTVEGNEECDDGNTKTGDGCSSDCRRPTAYRIQSVDLVDPQISVQMGGGGRCQCSDATSIINRGLQNRVDNYRANYVEVFRPLDTSESSNRMDFYSDASCNDNDMDMVDECSPGNSNRYKMKATLKVGSGGNCFTAKSSRINSSYTSPNSPSDPCFKAGRKDVTVSLAGCTLDFQDAVVAAEFSGSNRGDLTSGVLSGFVSEAEAKACTISNRLLCQRSRTLYQILDESNDNCGESADRDTNGGQSGWWFYLNFEASEADWSQ